MTPDSSRNIIEPQEVDTHDIFEYSVDPFLNQGLIEMKSYDSNEIRINEKSIELPFLMHGVQHPPEKKPG